MIIVTFFDSVVNLKKKRTHGQVTGVIIINGILEMEGDATITKVGKTWKSRFPTSMQKYLYINDQECIQKYLYISDQECKIGGVVITCSSKIVVVWIKSQRCPINPQIVPL